MKGTINMTNRYAKKFWKKYIGMASRGRTGSQVQNPSYQFRKKVADGEYDDISDEEFELITEDIESDFSIWKQLKEKTAGNMLLAAFARTNIPPIKINAIAEILADCSAKTVYCMPGELADDDPNDAEQLPDAGSSRDMPEGFTPKSIYDFLCARIHGQDDAKKAAAMVLYNTVAGGRSNTVFIGPTGCGKSEIWRRLQSEYPGLIRMIDASRLTADGWKGSFHLINMFDGISPEDIAARGLIIVMDEADKIFCEPMVGSNGTDFSAMIQAELLKMFDGDTVEFENANPMKANLSIDCSRVSFVMLGAFEKLLSDKETGHKSIGFGDQDSMSDEPASVTHEDLIRSGMRRELLGRVSRKVFLEPLKIEDYEQILNDNVISDIQKLYGYTISIDKNTAHEFARKAYSSGLGVRHMRSLVINALDDQIFESPDQKTYAI